MDLDIDTTRLLLALAVVLVAGLISGLAGFGFALTSVPIMLMLFDPLTVVVLSNSLTLISLGLVIVGQLDQIERRTVSGLLPAAAVGVLSGTVLLRGLNADAIKLLASVVVIAFAVVLVRGWVPRGSDRWWATALAGVTSGTLNASTGLAGPPIVMLLTARSIVPSRFRASTASYFFLIDIVTLSFLGAQQLLRWEHLLLVVTLAPAAAIGTVAGRRIARYVSPEIFRRLTLALLILTGFIGGVSATLALSAQR